MIHACICGSITNRFINILLFVRCSDMHNTDYLFLLKRNYDIKCLVINWYVIPDLVVCSEKVLRACKISDEYGVVRHTVQERERKNKSLVPATGHYPTPQSDWNGRGQYLLIHDYLLSIQFKVLTTNIYFTDCCWCTAVSVFKNYWNFYLFHPNCYPEVLVLYIVVAIE